MRGLGTLRGLWTYEVDAWGLPFPESPFHRLVHRQHGQHSSPKADGENETELRSAKWAASLGVVGGEEPGLWLWAAGMWIQGEDHLPVFPLHCRRTGLLPLGPHASEARADLELWPESVCTAGDTWRQRRCGVCMCVCLPGRLV